MDLDQEFQKAVATVNNLKKRPDDQELLEIYSLYKQATVGDCDQPKPNLILLIKRAKHAAWTSKKGMTIEAAKEAYVANVKVLVDKYQVNAEL